MSGNDCCCVHRISGKNVALIIAILFGVAVGILGLFCYLIVSLIGIAAFGLAFIALIVLLFVALTGNGNRRVCLCRYLFQLLTGIIGTLVFSLVLIFFSLILGPLGTSIIIGLTAFFFALMIGTFIYYILCIANCRQ